MTGGLILLLGLFGYAFVGDMPGQGPVPNGTMDGTHQHHNRLQPGRLSSEAGCAGPRGTPGLD